MLRLSLNGGVRGLSLLSESIGLGYHVMGWNWDCSRASPQVTLTCRPRFSKTRKISALPVESSENFQSIPSRVDHDLRTNAVGNQQPNQPMELFSNRGLCQNRGSLCYSGWQGGGGMEKVPSLGGGTGRVEDTLLRQLFRGAKLFAGRGVPQCLVQTPGRSNG